jgi:hypothetical protein
MHRMLRMGWRYRPDVPGVSGTLLTQMIGLRPTMAPRHADRFTKNRSFHGPHDELGRMGDHRLVGSAVVEDKQYLAY